MQATENELAVEVFDVERFAVEVNYCVGFVDHVPCGFDHVVVAVVVVAVEMNFLFAVPFSSEADDGASLNDLVEANVLIPKSPHVRHVGSGFYVQNKYLHLSVWSMCHSM